MPARPSSLTGCLCALWDTWRWLVPLFQGPGAIGPSTAGAAQQRSASPEAAGGGGAAEASASGEEPLMATFMAAAAAVAEKRADESLTVDVRIAKWLKRWSKVRRGGVRSASLTGSRIAIPIALPPAS